VLADAALRAELVERGKARVALFTWEGAAAALQAQLEALMLRPAAAA
jgi:hypothetical protein